MKPTPKTISNGNVHRSRTYWKFGTEFLGAEAIRNDATDFLLFTIIAGITAWPIVRMVLDITRLGS